MHHLLEPLAIDAGLLAVAAGCVMQERPLGQGELLPFLQVKLDTDKIELVPYRAGDQFEVCRLDCHRPCKLSSSGCHVNRAVALWKELLYAGGTWQKPRKQARLQHAS